MTYFQYSLKDLQERSSKKEFNYITFFAGGCGSSCAYKLAGGDVRYMNEFQQIHVDTYLKNFPNTVHECKDIKQVTGEGIMELTGLKKFELDILDGSPPCSAFSVAGKLSHSRDGKHSDGWGQTKNYSDGKMVENIEDLFFEFLRVADDIKPKVIIGENVKGLTIGEAKQYFNKIQNTFEDIGYDVCAKVLNSGYFGVPQTRNRVFFIGLRDDITTKVGLSFMNIHGIFPSEDKSMVTLGDALDNLEYDDEEVKTLTEKFSKTAYWKDTGSKMPNNPDKVLTGMDYHHKGHHFNLKRVSLKVPAPTLTAMGSNDTTAGAFHWNEPRKLTIGELKRIQSLPDDFKLTGKWNQKSERIGRMVPPLLLKAVADSVYNKVLKEL